jgi:hypothetical protein
MRFGRARLVSLTAAICPALLLLRGLLLLHVCRAVLLVQQLRVCLLLLCLLLLCLLLLLLLLLFLRRQFLLLQFLPLVLRALCCCAWGRQLAQLTVTIFWIAAVTSIAPHLQKHTTITTSVVARAICTDLQLTSMALSMHAASPPVIYTC